MKGQWDAQKSMGAKTRLSKIKPHESKPKLDGSEDLPGLFDPLLVPFAPLYEELNGPFDSEEQKHFAVMKSGSAVRILFHGPRIYCECPKKNLKKLQMGQKVGNSTRDMRAPCRSWPLDSMMNGQRMYWIGKHLQKSAMIMDLKMTTTKKKTRQISAPNHS